MYRMGRAGRASTVIQLYVVVLQIEGVYQEVLDGIGHGSVSLSSPPRFQPEEHYIVACTYYAPGGRGEHRS